MDKYKQLALRAKAFNEQRDCSVKAVALLTNASYDEAHRALAAVGRKNGFGVSLSTIIEALRNLGAHVSEGREPPAKTVRTLERVAPPGRFLVDTSTHVLAVIDGEIIDWTKGRLHRIIKLFEVSL